MGWWRTLVLAAFVLGTLAARGAEVEPRLPGVIDLHVDLSYRLSYKGASLAEGAGQVRAGWLERSGVAGVVLPLYIPRDVSPVGPRSADLAASWRRLLGAIARTPPYRAPGCGSAGAGVETWLAFEGAAPLAHDLRSLDDWLGRGVRLFGLVHVYDNALATSSSEVPVRQPTVGLTPAGRAVARRVMQGGGLVDVSHASDAATEDVLGLARQLRATVVATHSNARALAPHTRNLSDTQLAAIAATGGVIGINFHSPFLVARGTAHLDDVVRHIEHVGRVAGIEHVAIGSDFEGGIRPPRELADVRGFPVLARALLARGLSRDHLAAVFSGNARRVLCPAMAGSRAPSGNAVGARASGSAATLTLPAGVPR